MIPRPAILSASLPTPLRYAAIFYLLHILCQGWIGSSQGFLALSLFAAIVSIRRGDLSVVAHPLYFPLALFLVGSTVSAFAAPNPVKSAFEVGEWFGFLVFPLALSLYQRIPDLDRLAFRCILTLAYFLSLYGLFQYFILGHRDLEHRITGTTAHVMTYSGIILPISLLLLVFLLEKPDLVIAGATLLTSAVLVLTFTRGAWIGWLIGAATLVLLRRSRWFFYGLPILVFAVTLSPLAIFGRLVSTFDMRQSSNLDRVRMVEAGVEIIRDAPILGVGPSNIKEIYPLYRREDAPRFRIPHLHNNFIQIWAERGVVSVAAYLLLILMFLRQCGSIPRSNRAARTFADAGIVTAVSLATAGLFEFNFGDSEVLLNMLDLFALVSFGIASAGRTAPPSPAP